MNIRQEIHQLIDQISDTGAVKTLDYIQWLLADEDTLTPEELELVRTGEEQIERGEWITLDEFRAPTIV